MGSYVTFTATVGGGIPPRGYWGVTQWRWTPLNGSPEPKCTPVGDYGAVCYFPLSASGVMTVTANVNGMVKTATAPVAILCVMGDSLLDNNRNLRAALRLDMDSSRMDQWRETRREVRTTVHLVPPFLRTTVSNSPCYVGGNRDTRNLSVSTHSHVLAPGTIISRIYCQRYDGDSVIFGQVQVVRGPSYADAFGAYLNGVPEYVIDSVNIYRIRNTDVQIDSVATAPGVYVYFARSGWQDSVRTYPRSGPNGCRYP